tara:strand:- start:442 stop:702 length:261 start_codon:yes stop_codon:yes gene_type:complete
MMAYTNSQNMNLPEHEEAQRAFANALDTGRLSLKQGAWNYVGNYMYMGPSAANPKSDAFKHKVTREYLWPPRGHSRNLTWEHEYNG